MAIGVLTMASKEEILCAAERVVGAPVRDAVPILLSRKWTHGAGLVGVMLGVAIVSAVIANIANLDGILRGAVIGGLCVIAIQTGMSPRFLVRTEHGLLLTSATRWRVLPKESLGTVDALSVAVGSGIRHRTVTIGPESHRMMRRNDDRLSAILADLQGVKQPDVPPGYVPYQS